METSASTFNPASPGALGSTTPAAGSFTTMTATSTIRSGGFTVASLPAGVIGTRAYVTDATAPTLGAALVGGGLITIPVFYNGTIWVSA